MGQVFYLSDFQRVTIEIPLGTYGGQMMYAHRDGLINHDKQLMATLGQRRTHLKLGSAKILEFPR